MTEQLDDLFLNELWVSGVKQIKAVRVTLKSKGITRVVGTNKAGKSTLLDSIMYLIGGKETHPGEVIRRGENSAEVVGDLGTVIVTREWKKETGTKLKIRPKDGTQIKGGAQAWLDQRRGAHSFDAGGFLRLDKKKQVEIYKQLVGADTIAIDAAYKAAYDLRTAVSAKGKEMAAQYKAMPEPAADVPDEPVSVQALLDEQAKLQLVKSENDKARAEVGTCERALAAMAGVVDRTRARVAEAERMLADAQAALTGAVGDHQEAQDKLEEVSGAVAELQDPDLTAIYKQIAGAESTNAAVAAKKARAKLGAELDVKRGESIALSDKLEALLAAKEKLLKTAKVPVPGLGFTDEGLTLGGFPIEEASEAERTIAVVAIGLAQNPKLRFITLKNGNDIDDAGMAKLAAMAEEANAQLIIERMAHDDDECLILVADEDTILIKDGEASGARAKDPEPPAPALSADYSTPAGAAPDPAGSFTVTPMTPAEADIGTPPRLSLVPQPKKTPPPKPDKSKGPTFKKRPIVDLSADELAAAIAEVDAVIASAPLAPKSTSARAKREELAAEQSARLDKALDGDGPREPGSDG